MREKSESKKGGSESIKCVFYTHYSLAYTFIFFIAVSEVLVELAIVCKLPQAETTLLRLTQSRYTHHLTSFIVATPISSDSTLPPPPPPPPAELSSTSPPSYPLMQAAMDSLFVSPSMVAQLASSLLDSLLSQPRLRCEALSPLSPLSPLSLLHHILQCHHSHTIVNVQ